MKLRALRKRISNARSMLNEAKMSVSGCSCSQLLLCTHSKGREAHRQARRVKLLALYANPLYSLPTELMLAILERLDLSEYAALMVAAYHLLVHHGLAPWIDSIQLGALMDGCRGFHDCFRCKGSPLFLLRPVRCSIQFLPAELRLEIQKYLNPQDKINYVIAMANS